MDVGSNTVLVTGGASGIGLALAERFLQAGSDVIVCGRREERLRDVQTKYPRMRIRVCDLAKESGRVALGAWVTESFPRLNVIVNNAGIQRRVRMDVDEPWDATHEEIAINFETPVHISRVFIPHLLAQKHPAIINVTSGLAFVPLANAPIYSATKAALRSFTLSLRHQLRDTAIRVIEIIPPAVDTDLGGPGLHTFGVPLDEFANAAFAQLREGQQEIAYGFALEARRASAEQRAAVFERINAS